MKHELTVNKTDDRTTHVYGKHGHGCYKLTVNRYDNCDYIWMAVWYCDEETGDHPVVTEFNVEKTKVEFRRAIGRMMAKLCEGGYHLDAVHLLTDFVQDVA